MLYDNAMLSFSHIHVEPDVYIATQLLVSVQREGSM